MPSYQAAELRASRIAVKRCVDVVMELPAHKGIRVDRVGQVRTVVKSGLVGAYNAWFWSCEPPGGVSVRHVSRRPEM